MTYNELEAFLKVVELNSFSAASNALFITQPALSHKISYLEKELGYKLFNRQRGVHNVSLTREGSAFIDIAKAIMASMELSQSIPFIDHNKITVVYENALYTSMKSKVVNSFLTKAPGVHFSSASASAKEAYVMVEKGLADTALVTNPQHSDLVYTVPLLKEKNIVVSKKKLSDNTIINSSILDPSKEIRIPWSKITEQWHQIKFGKNTTPKITTDQTEIFQEFLKLDDVWFLAPPIIPLMYEDSYSFYCYELDDAPDGREMFYLKRKHASNNLIDVFIKSIKQTMGDKNIVTLF